MQLTFRCQVCQSRLRPAAVDLYKSLGMLEYWNFGLDLMAAWIKGEIHIDNLIKI